jgi:hypothetical protein
MYSIKYFFFEIESYYLHLLPFIAYVHNHSYDKNLGIKPYVSVGLFKYLSILYNRRSESAVQTIHFAVVFLTKLRQLIFFSPPQKTQDFWIIFLLKSLYQVQ